MGWMVNVEGGNDALSSKVKEVDVRCPNADDIARELESLPLCGVAGVGLAAVMAAKQVMSISKARRRRKGSIGMIKVIGRNTTDACQGAYNGVIVCMIATSVAPNPCWTVGAASAISGYRLVERGWRHGGILNLSMRLILAHWICLPCSITRMRACYHIS